MLEAALRADNSFITLTYSDDDLPSNASLNPLHLQHWLKRFRKAVSPLKIRYYAVGEYGDASERPHYHAAIFGYPTCERGPNSRGSNATRGCCSVCDLVRDTWGKGGVFVGALEMHSAQYVAGYVTKKMTRKDDLRLNGRHAEFGRMSLRPGIGADMMDEVASSLLEFNLEKSQPDVPSELAIGTRKMPLGRYLRRRLRERIGREKNAPPESLVELEEEMRDVLLRSISNEKTGGEVSPKKILVKDGDNAVRKIEAKQKIFAQRKVKL